MATCLLHAWEGKWIAAFDVGQGQRMKLRSGCTDLSAPQMKRCLPPLLLHPLPPLGPTCAGPFANASPEQKQWTFEHYEDLCLIWMALTTLMEAFWSCSICLCHPNSPKAIKP